MLGLGTREELDLELLLNGKVECEVDGHFDADTKYAHDDGGAKWKFRFSCPRTPEDVEYLLMCESFHILITAYMQHDDSALVACKNCGTHTIGEVYVGSVRFG